MMDQGATIAAEDFVHAGYPLQAAAVLLCESDGTPEEVEEEIARMGAVLERCGATEWRVSRDEEERLRFWAGRKAAFSGRLINWQFRVHKLINYLGAKLEAF